jgi:cobalamin biosynthesis Co2+ chelatase CbiK
VCLLGRGIRVLLRACSIVLHCRIVVLKFIAIPKPLLQSEIASLLLTLDWVSMLQDDYDQVMEMQAEALSRLARLNIVQNNAHGAQQLAERCLNLVAHAMEREQSDTGDAVRVLYETPARTA